MNVYDKDGNELWRDRSGMLHVEALVDTDAEMIAFLIGCLDALGHPVIKKRLASL